MRTSVRAAGLSAVLLATTFLTAPAGLAQAVPAATAQTSAEAITPAVSGVTAPKDFFAQEPGTDYYLANYDQYEAYLKRLAEQSDRIKLESFGTTEEGRTQWMGIVSSPANLANLERYQEIARKLAKAEGVSEEEARQLAAEGKAVVWIDAGLHATETVTPQAQVHVLYRLLTGQDAETLRTLDDTILIFGHVNPDGHQLVADWYMRNSDPQARSFRDIPRLYQKYTGHDNNRDSFMVTQAETRNANRIHYREWFPQIVFNQHQTGPRGMVVFIPPFRDPFNYNFDPLVMTTTTEVGTIMHSRLISEGKAGSGMDSAANYSTWHNGMYRSTPYFHNAVGILTEIIGGPTPEQIPLLPDVQLASNDKPMPIAPRLWHLRDSIEYQWTMN
ncbi:M14 family metallopeptidase, partial [Brevundimonas sp.]